MTIEEAIEKSKTMADAAKLLNMPYTTFIPKAKKLGLYAPNQSGRGKTKKFARNRYGSKIKTEEILDGKHPSYKTNALKKRLLSENIMLNICEECGISETWNEKPITLQLDYINGISSDHRLENLRLLCPNCHSQTDTWCGRNKK